MQFSLVSLILLVLAIGASMLALVYSSETLASIVLTATVSAWCVAVFQGWFSQTPNRIPWRAFAFGCGICLLLTIGPWFDEHVGKNLIITKLLEAWFATRPEEDAPQTISIFQGNGVITSIPAARFYFLMIGNSVIAMIVGALAAMGCGRRKAEAGF